MFVHQTAIRRVTPGSTFAVYEMERLWFDVVEGEKVRRQQMLQALVEFQFKAVNTRQTLTIIGAIHALGSSTQLPAKLPEQRSDGGADNQGAGEQGRPVRQSMYRGYRPRFRGALLAKDSLERMAMKRTRKIKEMRPKVSSHLNVSTAVTSITDADAQRTLNHKMAKRQKQRIHQLRIRPLPRLSRAGLSKCRLTISTIIRFGHPTRRNEYEIPAIRSEQRLELKTLSVCFLPDDQIH
ncbi:hypothetical protein STEG23_003005 [Scotinomys teguina]